MGAKDWLLVYSDGGDGSARTILQSRPVLDRVAARVVADRLYPGRVITPIDDGSFAESLNPEDGEIYVAAYPGLTIVSTSDAAEDYPSLISGTLRDAVPARQVSLHAMHSVVDWFAFAIWTDGTLCRALSLSPDAGILQTLGAGLPFEAPYWAGERALEIEDEDDHPYPLPFHPLELAEDALRELLGFCLEGENMPGDPDVDELPMAGFAIT
jgi:hypothetical protein